MILPKRNHLNISAFEDMLSLQYLRNSYKLFWFAGVFDEIKEKKSAIPFKTIAIRMIARSRVLILNHKLSFGSQDRLKETVFFISKKYEIRKDIFYSKLFDRLKKISESDQKINNKIEWFYKYVPYRLLTPFYPEIVGLEDHLKNNKIKKLSQKDDRAIYKIKNYTVYINKNWFQYIYSNQKIINSWLYNNIINFLKDRNPGKEIKSLEIERQAPNRQKTTLKNTEAVLNNIIKLFDDKNKKIQEIILNKDILAEPVNIITLRNYINKKFSDKYIYISLFELNNIIKRDIKHESLESLLISKLLDEPMDIIKLQKNLKHNCPKKIYDNDLNLLIVLNKSKWINKGFDGKYYIKKNLSEKDMPDFHYIYLLLKKNKDTELRNLLKNLFIKHNEDKLLFDNIFNKVLTVKPDLNKNNLKKFMNISEEFILVSKNEWALSSSNYNEFKQDFVFDFTKTFSGKRKERDINILLERILKNKTLAEIGDKNNLSRERVRQIVDKFNSLVIHPINYKKYKVYIEIIESLFNGKKIINIKKLNKIKAEYFNMIDNIKIINLYNFINKNDPVYIINDIFLSKLKKETIEGELIKYFEGNNKIINLMDFYGEFINLFDLDSIEKLGNLIDDVYVFNNKIFYATNKTEMVAIVLKEFFPRGVNLSKRQDFTKLRNLLNKIFPGIFKGDSSRAIRGNIEREGNNIIGLGSGKFIHIDHINVEESHLIMVKNYIIERLKNKKEVKIDYPFNEFKDYLRKININSKYKLYSLLKKYFHSDIYLPKYPRILSVDDKGKEILECNEIIENYILRKNGIVDEASLKDYFHKNFDWDEMDIYNHVKNNPKLTKIQSNFFVHLDYYKEEMNELEGIINKIMDDINNSKNSFININPDYLSKNFKELSYMSIISLLKDNDRLILLGIKDDEHIVMKSDNQYKIKTNIDFLTFVIGYIFNGMVRGDLLEDYLEDIGFTDGEIPSQYKYKKDLPFLYFKNEFILKVD